MAGHSLNAPVVDPSFLRRTSAGVTVELRAQPRSRRPGLAWDGVSLKAAVAAPAEDGKANSAVIDLLVRQWRLPKSVFGLVRGATQRDKVISISGEPDRLAERIAEWIRNRHRAGET